MINKIVKKKIDKLFEVVASGGKLSTFDVIEQITYLIFIKDLEEMERKQNGESIFAREFSIGNQKIDAQLCKWSTFHLLPADQMFNIIRDWVFPFTKSLEYNKCFPYAKYMQRAVFKIPNPNVCLQVIHLMDDIYTFFHKFTGEAYEYLLDKRNHSYDIAMIIKKMDPKPDDTICDPTCGLSDFLVKVFAYNGNRSLTGYDNDPQKISIGAMNMILHGITQPHIKCIDSLSELNTDYEKYSLVFAQPPLNKTVDRGILSQDLRQNYKTNKIDILYLGLCLRLLKEGGRCAFVVSKHFLSSSARSYQKIREQIIEDHCLNEVICTYDLKRILVFTKTNGGGTHHVTFSNRDQTLLVTKKELQEHHYSLLMEDYQKETSIQEKINELIVKEKEISNEMSELENVLKELI